MICRLFCKHAKRCKSDLRLEEQADYERRIEELRHELDLANKNVSALTEQVDLYEITLQQWQNDYYDVKGKLDEALARVSVYTDRIHMLNGLVSQKLEQ